MIEFATIIEKLSLQEEFSFILQNNKSNWLPYHNLRHTICMVENCYEGALYENLSEEYITKLIIAALFHDTNHSGGAQPDSENVKNAKSLASIFFSTKDEAISLEDYTEIIDIISATEFPYTIENHKLTLQQKIIRDADLLQAFREDSTTQTFFGLMREFKTNDFEKFYEGQTNFLQSAELSMRTNWGAWQYKTNLKTYLNSVAKLKQIVLPKYKLNIN